MKALLAGFIRSLEGSSSVSSISSMAFTILSKNSIMAQIHSKICLAGTCSCSQTVLNQHICAALNCVSNFWSPLNEPDSDQLDSFFCIFVQPNSAPRSVALQAFYNLLENIENRSMFGVFVNGISRCLLKVHASPYIHSTARQRELQEVSVESLKLLEFCFSSWQSAAQRLLQDSAHADDVDVLVSSLKAFGRVDLVKLQSALLLSSFAAHLRFDLRISSISHSINKSLFSILLT